MSAPLNESLGPFAGLRCLDLSTEVAGPYATKMLVDAGADVIKLEEPGGDPLRRWTASGIEIPAGEDGALFRYLNASKRSVVADLGTARGRELVLDLAATVDLVVESFGPEGLERRGIAPDALRRRNPALSIVSISPWGRTGPWAHRPATEWTVQAATGSTAYRGLPSRGPLGNGGRLGDWVTGSYVAIASLCMVLSARRTRRGLHADLSMFECLVLSMTQYHDLQSQFFGSRHLPQNLETPSIEPAKDGWVGLCTYTGQQWKDFCTLIGRPDVGEDPRFYESRERMEHLEFIQGMIHAWTREHTVDEIIEIASALRIPVAPIGHGKNLPEMDHFRARGVFVRNPHGFLQPRIPYRLGDAKDRPFGPAPRLDEHGDEIRRELATPRPSSRTSSKPDSGTSALPFEGVRIVDLTAFWAGPIVTALFADMGADVIKVESIQRPDGMRFAGAVPGENLWERSAVFHGANCGKRDVTLNLDSEEGRALLEQLLAGADALTENFSVRVLDQFGLTRERIEQINPRLIVMRMPAFGLDGPWRDRTGFASNVEQVSGLAWITGYQDMPLIPRGVCDPAGGMHAAFALACALEQRRKTGKGMILEVPLVEPGLNMAAEQVIEYSAYGQFLERSGNRGPCAAPQGIYPCAGEDLWVAIAVVTDEQWRALREILGDPEWARAPELDAARGRRAQHDRIDEAIRAWTRERTREEAAERLRGTGIPATEVTNGWAIHPNPQLEHREFFQIQEHPFGGRLRYPGQPMRVDGLGPPWHKWVAPTLGQHNEEILRDVLGLDERRIEELREHRVIGTRPAHF